MTMMIIVLYYHDHGSDVLSKKGVRDSRMKKDINFFFVVVDVFARESVSFCPVVLFRGKVYVFFSRVSEKERDDTVVK